MQDTCATGIRVNKNEVKNKNIAVIINRLFFLQSDGNMQNIVPSIFSISQENFVNRIKCSGLIYEYDRTNYGKLFNLNVSNLSVNYPWEINNDESILQLSNIPKFKGFNT